MSSPASVASSPCKLELGKPLPDAQITIWQNNNGTRKVVLLSSLLSQDEFNCIICMPAPQEAESEKQLQGFSDWGNKLWRLGTKVFIVTTDTIHSMEAWMKNFREPVQYSRTNHHFTMISDCNRNFGKSAGLLTSEDPSLGTVLNRAIILVHKGIVKSVKVENRLENMTPEATHDLIEALKKWV